MNIKYQHTVQNAIASRLVKGLFEAQPKNDRFKIMGVLTKYGIS